MNITCIFCDQPLKVASDYPAPEITCPKCGKEFPLPSAQSTRAGKRDDRESRPSWRPGLSGVVSFLFHAVVLAILSLVTWANYDLGASEEVRIGQLPVEKLGNHREGQLDAPEDVSHQSQLDDTVEIAPRVPLPDPSAWNADPVEPPSRLGDPAFNSPELSGGPGDDGLPIRFMDIAAKGNRICIIADCSGSMDGPPLEYLKDEILETVTSMKGPRARFQVVFFSTDAIPFPNDGWLRPKTDAGALRQWLSTISAGGLTEPGTAFETAFRLSPKPDVIFFMTDGQFEPAVVDQVARLNADRDVTIHAISFIDKSSEPMMKAIASASRGTYRHVDFRKR